MCQRLTLKLMGGFQVREPAETAMPTRKVEALLAYLALPPGRRRDRAELTALLWGSRDERHARHSLNQALSSLRKAFAGSLPALFEVDGGGVALAAPCDGSDVAEWAAYRQCRSPSQNPCDGEQ